MQRQNTTLGVIKPHAVKEGLAGLMLDLIHENFAVSAMQMFTLSTTEAGEFLEVYKGVVPPGELSSMVDEMTAGPCIAVEVRAFVANYHIDLLAPCKTIMHC